MKRRNYAYLLMLCLGIVLTLSGCSTLSSLNPFARKAPPRNVPAGLTEILQTKNARVIWSNNSVGSSKTFMFTPAFTYDAVYAASANGTVMKMNPYNGQTVWSINAGMNLTAGVGSEAGIVAVAGEKGMVLAYDADGKQLWKAQLKSEILSAPAVSSDLVIVRSLDNTITAFDAHTGERKWFVSRKSPALTLRSAPGIAIVGPIAVVALPGGRLTSIVMQNGVVHWDISVGEPKGTTELERVTDTSGYPAIYRSIVCAAAYQGRVGCYELASGRSIWSKNLSSDVGVSIDDNHVYAADVTGAVYAFSNDGGVSIWKNDRLAYRGLSAPAALRNAVAVGDYQGYIHFLSRDNGSFVARLNVDGSAIGGAPLVAGNNRLIVQTISGTVAAILVD